MADVLFVVLTVSFFGVASVVVRACERILGTDVPPPALEEITEPEPVAAP